MKLFKILLIVIIFIDLIYSKRRVKNKIKAKIMKLKSQLQTERANVKKLTERLKSKLYSYYSMSWSEKILRRFFFRN